MLGVVPSQKRGYLDVPGNKIQHLLFGHLPDVIHISLAVRYLVPISLNLYLTLKSTLTLIYYTNLSVLGIRLTVQQVGPLVTGPTKDPHILKSFSLLKWKFGGGCSVTGTIVITAACLGNLGYPRPE